MSIVDDPQKTKEMLVRPEAARLYAERFILPMLYQWRGFWVAVALFLIALLEAVALVILLPLKQAVPYIVQVEHATGRVVIDPQPLGVFHPELQNIAYFIHVWARSLLSVDERSLSDRIPLATSWLQGSAVNELKAFLAVTRPAEQLAGDPKFRRLVQIDATNWLNHNRTCLLELTQIDTKNGVEVQRQRFVLTIAFHLLSPGHIHVDEDNPLGIVITHFSLSALQ